MVKKGPLGTAELFYVKAHYGMNSEKAIAEKLDRSVQSIRKAISKFEKEAVDDPDSTKDVEDVETENLEVIDGSSLFVNEHGATVMTPHASMYGDDMAKQRANNHNSRNQRCTVPIKDKS